MSTVSVQCQTRFWEAQDESKRCVRPAGHLGPCVAGNNVGTAPAILVRPNCDGQCDRSLVDGGVASCVGKMGHSEGFHRTSGGVLFSDEPNEGFASPREAVNHPPHYGGDTTYEHIKVVRAWGLNYELGNATKYICRAGKKDQSKTLEDLEKAVWYLQAEIERRRQERK